MSAGKHNDKLGLDSVPCNTDILLGCQTHEVISYNALPQVARARGDTYRILEDEEKWKRLFQLGHLEAFTEELSF